ncbi:hypothetical protein HBH89_140460 [Parastagonospora nodorum]|nr:hypothetical protein HBH93_053170 [Parastagonospora nodorum]KAH4459981.1 hypothetical protein HBH91_072290 [Parastagonospora nodorum]KAH4497045.1 hypothetical protein HBH89_140460 [Parastagonospora nodorum]KAH4535285.1 hypothetical protein HBH85_163800 [Parastagonospora nodorum]KAH4562253.1 hypothetical protein HBH86_054560 [Parastagonospora nodorum]
MLGHSVSALHRMRLRYHSPKTPPTALFNFTTQDRGQAALSKMICIGPDPLSDDPLPDLHFLDQGVVVGCLRQLIGKNNIQSSISFDLVSTSSRLWRCAQRYVLAVQS